ncbi:unnamed protein product [Sphenostylis stenocarpa]|uniref:Uncharacterized protein n=1 Tax=Sphenostylis stenocarpa TaxID=92480 RepID=A0AA86TL40_9FABA|nr:unnamed protein product [Sphenostylis stenocarpa]
MPCVARRFFAMSGMEATKSDSLVQVVVSASSVCVGCPVVIEGCKDDGFVGRQSHSHCAQQRTMFPYSLEGGLLQHNKHGIR